jgi:predicted membrane protein
MSSLQGGLLGDRKALLLIALICVMLLATCGCVTLDPDDYSEATNSTPVTVPLVEW